MSIFEVADVIVFAALLSGLFLSIALARKFKSGTLNLLFVSYVFSIFFFSLSQLFGFLQGIGLYNLHEVTYHLWQHLIIYCGVVALIWGGYRTKVSIGSDNAIGFGRPDMIVLGTLLLFAALLFVLPLFLEESLAPIVIGSPGDLYGLHHVLIFLGGCIAMWYLYYIRGHWGLVSTNITYVIAFLFLIGVLHAWEIVTESEKLRLFTLPSSVIEGVESLILIPAALLFALGQWKILSFMRSHQGMPEQ